MLITFREYKPNHHLSALPLSHQEFKTIDTVTAGQIAILMDRKDITSN